MNDLKPVEVFQQTKVLLQEKGWLKHYLSNDHSFCIMGALNQVMTGTYSYPFELINHEKNPVVALLAKAVPEDFTEVSTLRELQTLPNINRITSYNNNGNTRQEDIFSVLDKAIELATIEG